MPAASFARAIYLTMLSGSKQDRQLFRAIQTQKPTKIVEIGVDSADRTTNMLQLAARYQPVPIQYTAIDLFEARGGANPLSLKQAHHRFGGTGAKVRLVPGELVSAVARAANSLPQTDMILLGTMVGDTDMASLQPFIPRMVHPKSHLARFVRTGKSIEMCWDENLLVATERRAA